MRWCAVLRPTGGASAGARPPPLPRQGSVLTLIRSTFQREGYILSAPELNSQQR